MRLIVTRYDSNIDKIGTVTLPILKQYALKVKADFKILDDNKGMHGHWRILQCYNLFEKYNRILVLDSDILISPKCPDLFEVVPHTRIGTIYEDVGTRESIRKQRMDKIQKKLGYVGWQSGYINTGVFLMSRKHKDILLCTDEELEVAGSDEMGYDDILLGYKMVKAGYKVHQLPFQYNHMTMFSEEWNNYASRWDSYIMHYAGVGLFIPCKNRTELIKQDALLLYSRWDSYIMHYADVGLFIPCKNRTELIKQDALLLYKELS